MEGTAYPPPVKGYRLLNPLSTFHCRSNHELFVSADCILFVIRNTNTLIVHENAEIVKQIRSAECVFMQKTQFP